MTYKLTFLKSAKKEWDKLDIPIKERFKAKLIQRIEEPHVPRDKLAGMNDCYKIKLRALGCRLVYKVIKEKITIQVIAAGKRNKEVVYKYARNRMNQM